MKKLFVILLLTLWQTFLSAEGTVVLVHGFMNNSLTMHPLQKVARQACFDTYMFDYDSRNDYIESHAESLADALRYLAARNPGKPIHFITHSIGALVLRAALNVCNVPEEALHGKAILLAPPNQGSYLARSLESSPVVRAFMGDKSGMQLMTFCPDDYPRYFGEFPSTMQILVIAGKKGIHPIFNNIENDTYLTVDETRLCTPHCHKVLCLNHGQLITHRSSRTLIRNFLLCGQ